MMKNRLFFVSIFIFLVGFFVTIYISDKIQKQALAEKESLFEKISERVCNEIEERLILPEYGLHEMRSTLLNNPETLDRKKFQLFIETSAILNKFPGVHGFGFVQKVLRKDLNRFIEDVRSDNASDFSVKTSGTYDDLYIIRHIEPLKINLPAWGYDLGSEEVRRETILKAIQTDNSALTKKITLLQDPKKEGAFLLFLPLFRSHSSLKSSSDLIGLVYCPIIISELLNGIEKNSEGLINFKIYDDPKNDPLKNSAIFETTIKQETFIQNKQNPSLITNHLIQESLISVAGRTLKVVTISTPKFELLMHSKFQWYILISGTLISLLLSFTIWQLLNTRKTAVMKLQETTSMISSILDSSTEISIISTNKEGIITLFNKGAERLLGYSADEMIGKNSPKIFHDENEVRERGEQLSTQLQQNVSGFDVFNVIPNQRGSELREWTYIHKNGSRFRVSLVVTLVTDSLGQKIGYLGIAQNISKRTQYEKQLKIATELAIEASRTKSDFLATMSHEIRTPLNGIVGMIKLLVETPLNPQQLDMAKAVDESSATLLSLINDILDFSKIEEGKLDIDPHDFSLQSVIKNVMTLFSVKAKEKNVLMIAHLDPTIPDTLHGDSHRLRQILSNLISNAIKFTAKGSVTLQASLLSTESSDLDLCFTIIDSGIGIPPDKINRLFKSFSQVDSSTSRQFGGSGLGLAICKKLVELMGGKIQVKSSPNVGSEFSFTLPLKRGNQQNLISESKPKILHRSKKIETSVLLVEDNRINQKLAIFLLEKEGLQIDIAENGIEAIEALKKKQYQLVFMDMQMPLMDGLTATRQIRENNSGVLDSTVPIIAMTANAMSGDRDICIEAGMNDYLSKPLDLEKLRAILNLWIPSSTISSEDSLSSLAPSFVPATFSFDHEDFLLRTHLSKQDAALILADFLKEIPKQIEEFETTLTSGDHKKISDVIHTMRGTTSNLSATSLLEIVIQIQTHFHNHQLEKAQGLLPMLKIAFNQFQNTVELFINSSNIQLNR